MTYIRRPEDAIYRYLDNVGDGSGYSNFNHENSASATVAKFTADENCLIERLLFSIEDTSGFAPEEYGNTGAALANGYKFIVLNAASATAVDLCDGVPITTNANIGRTCYDVDVKNWGNTPTDELLVGRWTFARAGQALFLPKNYSLVAYLTDDFTGLVEHYFQIQGYKHYRSGGKIENAGLIGPQ